jgi:hypothetical protein
MLFFGLHNRRRGWKRTRSLEALERCETADTPDSTPAEPAVSTFKPLITNAAESFSADLDTLDAALRPARHLAERQQILEELRQ